MSINGNGILNPVLQFEDQNGLPYAGGSVGFTQVGTNTPQNVYGDPGLTIALPNPVPLNAAGRTSTSGLGPDTGVYAQLLPYDLTLRDVNGVTIYGPITISGSPLPPGATIPATTFVSIAVNGLVDLSAAGAGQIKFPATENPSSDVNTLDDYEEGTWTPVIGGSGGTSGQTYTAQVGLYVKIGRLVNVSGFVLLSAKGTITGTVQLNGLPFNVANISNYVPAPAIGRWNIATAVVSLGFALTNNTATGTLIGATAAATVPSTFTTSDIGNTSSLQFTFSYLTDN